MAVLGLGSQGDAERTLPTHAAAVRFRQVKRRHTKTRSTKGIGVGEGCVLSGEASANRESAEGNWQTAEGSGPLAGSVTQAGFEAVCLWVCRTAPNSRVRGTHNKSSRSRVAGRRTGNAPVPFAFRGFPFVTRFHESAEIRLAAISTPAPNPNPVHRHDFLAFPLVSR